MNLKLNIHCCCLGTAPRASGYFILIGNKTLSAARDSSEVTRALNQRCYPYPRNGGFNWCLGSSPSLSVGFSIQDEALGVARSAPRGGHYHADFIDLLH